MRSLQIAILAIFLASAAHAKTISVSFETRAAVIDKVTRGGNVVVFSIARQQVTYQWGHTVIWRDVVTDTDGDGSVRFETPEDIEPERLWVIVDQATGDYLVRRTDGDSLHIPPGQVKHEKDDRGGKLTIAGRAAHVLLIRPGEDTWRDMVGDGGDADADASANGTTVIHADKLKGFKKADAKAKGFDKNDTVVVIDPLTLAVYASRIQ